MSIPSNCISVAEAQQLQENWVGTRGLYVEEGMGAPDTREFLFSVEELQEFLDYVKAGTKEHKPGIRVYFAAYGPDESNKSTVFLAPTLGVDVDSENNYDLQPLNRALNGLPPKNY